MKVVGLAGWSEAGKTTLIERLIPYFTARGLLVSTIKHAHHNVDIDRPGKDSYRHREAGASEVLLASSSRVVLMQELRGAPEPPLPALIARLAPVDLVLIEGFRAADHPKVEVHRTVSGMPLLFPGDAMIKGIASDVAVNASIPCALLDDIPAVAAMLLAIAAAAPR
jgi:molybdopterin-guanine dinucleotide biosynthesis protein B